MRYGGKIEHKNIPNKNINKNEYPCIKTNDICVTEGFATEEGIYRKPRAEPTFHTARKSLFRYSGSVARARRGCRGVEGGRVGEVGEDPFSKRYQTNGRPCT